MSINNNDNTLSEEDKRYVFQAFRDVPLKYTKDLKSFIYDIAVIQRAIICCLEPHQREKFKALIVWVMEKHQVFNIPKEEIINLDDIVQLDLVKKEEAKKEGGKKETD